MLPVGDQPIAGLSGSDTDSDTDDDDDKLAATNAVQNYRKKRAAQKEHVVMTSTVMLP